MDRDSRAMNMGRVRLFAGVAALVIAVVVAIGLVLGVFGSSEDTADGRIAFVSDRDGDAEIYVMNADGSGVVQLTENDSSDWFPAWSPDGMRILFTSDRGNDLEVHDIYVMNADGSGVEQLTYGFDNYSPVWSPDGDRIAFASRAEIYVMNADGSGAKRLTYNNSVTGRFVFYEDRDRDGAPEVYVRNADGSGVERLTEYDYGTIGTDSVDQSPSWSPDGGRIVFQSSRGGAMEIYVMNADGSGVDRLTYDKNLDWFPAWSPDGGRIAFFSGPDYGGMDIYVMNVDGSGVERLTDNEYFDGVPVWSPDGGRIVFQSSRGGAMEIYVMNADGSGVVRLVEGHSPAWSPLLD